MNVSSFTDAIKPLVIPLCKLDVIMLSSFSASLLIRQDRCYTWNKGW